MSRAGLTAAATGGALGLALLGCAGMQDDAEDIFDDMRGGPRAMVFECDDDRELTVILSRDREEARVDADGRDYELEEAGRNDDGDRVYADEGVRLTLGGDEAHLRVPGGDDYQDCEER